VLKELVKQTQEFQIGQKGVRSFKNASH